MRTIALRLRPGRDLKQELVASAGIDLTTLIHT